MSANLVDYYFFFFVTGTLKSLGLKLKKKKFKCDGDIYYSQTKVV